METKTIKFNVNNGKTNMFVTVEFENLNPKAHTLLEINSIKRATKKFNNLIMESLKGYPTGLIEFDLKEYLNEVCNVNIKNVNITDIKVQENEMDM